MMLFGFSVFANAEEEPEAAAEGSVSEETSEEAATGEEAETSTEDSTMEEEPEGPSEISSAEELKEIADKLTADYVLTADIDLAGREWIPLGTYIPSRENE